MISIRGIVKRYGTIEALKDISFTIEDSDTVAIVGPNGSGKSTLLRILAYLERADSGDLKTDYDAREVTLVFQKSVMFSTTVYKNVAYGLRIRGVSEVDERVMAALKSVGLEGFEGRYAKKLSGGEQQRVAIARALALKPKVLLLDEPTANLDNDNARIVEEFITKQRGGLILLSTHNLFQVKRLAQKTIFLKNGRLVEMGETKKLFESPEKEETNLFFSGKEYF